MKNNACIGVIIPAAGSGSRMGGVYKPLEKLCGKPMLFYSLDTFQNCSEVEFVVISAREDKVIELTHLCQEYGYSKVKKIVVGGSNRQQSVKNAFECGLFDNENITHVAIHDAARPLFSSEMAKNVFAMAVEKTNAVCASRVRDTVKRTNDENVVSGGIDRDNLWLIQTPQVFEKNMYKNALDKAEKEGFVATDDSSLVAQNGVNVNLCETPSQNIKITYPEDVLLAEAIIEKRG
ncbi:MAG: 2-C-methyl-D-erythritol 4-phosphate cytidylyltransferase [Ruminococcaceae bacterium]|nr:2-C-methyl-D-erythritol 4-phosphate cytidylyltransferase [Oscillospiraceae bacterium]